MKLVPLGRFRQMTSVALVATACALTVFGVAGSSPEPQTTAASKPQTADRPLPGVDQAVWDARGTVIGSEPMRVLTGADFAELGVARRAVYRSVSAIDGQGSEVSGTFFVPKGHPPEGGWPVISFAHGTTGLTTECGPSTHSDLMGYASTVAGLLNEGFAVAFTDYQGLGHPGVHPYLEPRTAAFNVIDAVRALRAQFPEVSTRWMSVGESQGGQASWAANEHATDYGAGLDLVGSIALSPGADMSGLAAAAANGTLTNGQIALMPLIITGLERIDPALVESDYLRGAAGQYKAVFISCAPETEKAQLYPELDADQVKPISPVATSLLQGLLQANALPQRPLSAPLLVVNGTADELIPPQWVTAAVSRACRLGGTVMHIELSGHGHNDTDFGDSEFRWAHDRFAGKPAPSNCTR